MNRVEYNQYVQKIEKLFNGNPEGLAKKALFYAVASYLYITAVILVASALLAGLVLAIIYLPNALTIKIGLVAGIGIFVLILSIVKGLNVKVGAPEGIPLVRKEAPELFALLDDLRKNVANAKFDKVLMTGDFNAAVCQIPRLGILGWYHSYLILGLPLMQALSPAEFKAVLAHEFAHLSNQDGTSGNWIYRIRRSWEQIMAGVFAGGGSGSWALAPFVNWFWPRFNGHAFVLSRLHEYRADAAAAAYAGSEAVGTSLQRVAQYARLVEEKTWSGIFELANDTDVPPADPYDRIKHAVESPLDPEVASEWVTQSFARLTDYSDTHPALKDRLEAVGSLPPEILEGLPPIVLPPNSESSSTAFLGAEKETELIAKMNREWIDSLSELWKERYEEVQKIRTELGNESEVVDADGAWKWAEAMLNLKGAEDAMPWVEKTLGFDPDHIGAKYTKGCYLVEKGDSRGAPMLEAVTVEEPMLGLEALGMLKMYYSNLGETLKFIEIDHRADAYDDLLERARVERDSITRKDIFMPHEIGNKMLTDLQNEFKDFAYIKEVFIARKEVTHFPKSPMYVIAVIPKPGILVKDTASDFIAQCLAPVMDGAFYVMMKKDNKPVAKIICAMPDSLVYSRESSDG